MIGQYKRDLTIVAYRPEWPALFKREATYLRRALGTKALQIEHIGSTSVPGLAAKPIVDMVVAVTSYAQAMALIPSLEEVGYLYRPHDIIPDRLFLAKERAAEIRTHHLSLTEPDSGYWQKHLAFRDYLRSHDQVAAEYVNLKRQLAEEYARTGVLPSEGKTAFVAQVLELARQEGMYD
jgi:GrpB-like predicted nucleotidyltransferase (UPF0157 family)